MSTPYWAHCNLCAELMASNKTSFYALSCSHLLCKNCMHHTDRGTNCPVCKATITFQDFKKLTEKQKEKFEPGAINELKKPINILKFQRTQQSILAKLTQQQKIKAKMMAQKHAEMKARIEKKKQALDKLKQQRRLMQQHLKQIYEKNQKKEASMMFRQQQPSFSTAASTSSRTSTSTINSAAPSFFRDSRNPHSAANFGQSLAFNSVSFFQSRFTGRVDANGTRSSISVFGIEQQPRTFLKRAQSLHRSPFFA